MLTGSLACLSWYSHRRSKWCHPRKQRISGGVAFLKGPIPQINIRHPCILLYIAWPINLYKSSSLLCLRESIHFVRKSYTMNAESTNLIKINSHLQNWTLLDGISTVFKCSDTGILESLEEWCKSGPAVIHNPCLALSSFWQAQTWF